MEVQCEMGEKTDVRQGTLALMILKTLEFMGPQHGYGIARPIEESKPERIHSCSVHVSRSASLIHC